MKRIEKKQVVREWTVNWTYARDDYESEGYSVIEAKSKEEAERKFWKTHHEMNPYKGQFWGYVIEKVF